MRKYDIPDEQKDKIAQRNAEHYCKLYGIKDPDMRLIFARGRSIPSWYMAYMFCVAAMKKEDGE